MVIALVCTGGFEAVKQRAWDWISVRWWKARVKNFQTTVLTFLPCHQPSDILVFWGEGRKEKKKRKNTRTMHGISILGTVQRVLRELLSLCIASMCYISCILLFTIEASTQYNDSAGLMMESKTFFNFSAFWMSQAGRWSVSLKSVLWKNRLKFGVGRYSTHGCICCE